MYYAGGGEVSSTRKAFMVSAITMPRNDMTTCSELPSIPVGVVPHGFLSGLWFDSLRLHVCSLDLSEQEWMI